MKKFNKQRSNWSFSLNNVDTLTNLHKGRSVLIRFRHRLAHKFTHFEQFFSSLLSSDDQTGKSKRKLLTRKQNLKLWRKKNI